MTVRRHEDWGGVGPVPAGAVEVASDREARAVVEAARRRGDELPVLLLRGGDLCRTLGGGGPGRGAGGTEVAQVTADLGAVLVDGQLHWFVAHLVARRGWWCGRVWSAMNAQFLGDWDVAPRAHPGDGLLDVLDVGLRLGDRLAARRRLPTGTHVPHPDLAERRTASVEVAFDPPLDVWLDGERVGRARELSVRVEPDALRLCV